MSKRVKKLSLEEFKRAVNKLSYEFREEDVIRIPVSYLIDTKREIERLENRIKILEDKYKQAEQGRKDCLAKLINQELNSFDFYV